MKTAKEIREMLKEPGKNVYIQFVDGGLSHRIIDSKSVGTPSKTAVKCLTYNGGLFFTICSDDMIFCQ